MGSVERECRCAGQNTFGCRTSRRRSAASASSALSPFRGGPQAYRWKQLMALDLKIFFTSSGLAIACTDSSSSAG